MPNVDSPCGLRPIRHRNGAPFNGAGSLYYIPATNSHAIAPGDPVVVDGGADTHGIPRVIRATAGAGNAITGAVIGRANGRGVLLQSDSPVLPEDTEGYVLVADDPDIVFEAQMSAGFSSGNMSSNSNLVAGTPSGGKSGWEVNTTDIATGSTLQVKILRLVQREDNEVGANAKVEVMINNHTQSHNKAGV